MFAGQPFCITHRPGDGSGGPNALQQALRSQQLLPLPGGGRVVGTELLVATPAARNCIREGKSGQLKSILQTGSELSMHSMDQDLARMVKENKIPYDLANEYSYDPKDLQRLVFETNIA